jgi:hypothetical protein
MLSLEVRLWERRNWALRGYEGFPNPHLKDLPPDPGKRLRGARLAYLERELEAAAERANGGARVRRVRALRADHILAHPHGIMEENGGLLKGWGRAEWSYTSVVSAAWTTIMGEKVVRLCGSRRRSCGFSDPFLFLPGAWDGDGLHPCWALTFPERFTRLRQIRARRLLRILDRIGPPGGDDRVNLALHVTSIRAHMPGVGVILSDNFARPQMVQVVVRDPSTSLRHHISVPPRFGDPQSKTFQRLGTSAARIRAALAWTFDLKPDEYAPALEA